MPSYIEPIYMDSDSHYLHLSLSIVQKAVKDMLIKEYIQKKSEEDAKTVSLEDMKRIFFETYESESLSEENLKL